MTPIRKARPKWAEPLTLFLILTLTLPLVYHFARIGFDPHHAGLMYKSALDVANGAHLFSETFTQYGALVTWMQALSLLVLGKQVTSILFCTALFYALSFAMLYLVSRRFLGPWLSLTATVTTVFLAAFYFWDFHPWSSVYALFFLLLSLYLSLLALDRTGWRFLLLTALSGLCAALVFWCRQPAGLVAILAGLICFGLPAVLLRRYTQRRMLYGLLLFVAGAAAGLLLLFIPIAATGATADFVTQSIGGMFSFLNDRSYAESRGIFFSIGLIFANLLTLPSMRTDLFPVLNVMWSLLPLAAVGLTVFAVVRIRLAIKKEDGEEGKALLPTLFYGVFAACAWHQYYPVACFRHWYWGAFLCVPAALLCLRGLVDWLAHFERLAWLRPERRRLCAFALAAALLLAPNACTRVGLGIEKTVKTADRIPFESEDYAHLNDLYLSPEVADHYRELFAVIADLRERYPDRNVVNLTENGIYAVFGENFHPMFNNAGDFYYDDYPAAKDAYIAAARPILIGTDGVPEDYVLYYVPVGFSGDQWEDTHRMPPYVYIPPELMEN